MIAIALMIALEALYVDLCIVFSKNEKLSVTRHFLLFVGIIIANLISGVLFASVFRFLCWSVLTYGVMILIYKRNVKFFDIFVLFCILFLKTFLEYVILHILGWDIDSISHTIIIIVGAIIAILPLITKALLARAYFALGLLWKKDNTFYIRYVLCILFICAILLYMHVIIKLL